MPTACLIVCEKTGRWAAAFRRALAGHSQALSETRSLAHCGRELADSPASVVAIEITPANLEAVCQEMLAWSHHYPAARLLALAERGLETAEVLLREAGALDVLFSTRDVPAASRLVVRRLALAPVPALPWREALQNRLPWDAWATPPG